MDYKSRHKMWLILLIVSALVLDVLIWFFGEWLTLNTPTARLSAITSVTLFAVAAGLRLQRKRYQYLNALYNAEKPSVLNGDYEPNINIKVLQKQFLQAVQLIKYSDTITSVKGKKALHVQPWYLVIGPSATGKSTFLANTGLDFQAAGGDWVNSSDEGGAQGCDWHFSRQAVFLDTPGRYISDGRARHEWLSLLKLLRRYRAGSPLNGVIVTISMTELLSDPISKTLTRTVAGQGTAETVNLALLQERINELSSNLGCIVPIYFVFTQCDRVPGFAAYFADLSDTEREQVFGASVFTAGRPEQQGVLVFISRLKALVKKLQMASLSKVAKLHEQQDKVAVIEFPNRFKAASARLTDLMGTLFNPKSYDEFPHFAGIYFTSAVQDNETRHRRSTASRPFFIRRLFSDIILPLQGMIKPNRSSLRFQLSFKAVLTSLLFIVALSGASFMLTAYLALQDDFVKNKSVINDLVKAVNAGDEHHQALTGSLLALRARSLSLNEEINRYATFLPYMDISAKSALVKKEMEALYHYLLNYRIEYELLPLLKARMEVLSQRGEQGEQGGRWRREYYDLLKVSLMLTTERERLDQDFVITQLARLWQRQPQTNDSALESSHTNSEAESYQALMLFISTYLEQLQPYHSDSPVWQMLQQPIITARAQLDNPLGTDELYELLKVGTASRPVLTLADILSARYIKYMSSEQSVPWLFTREGWDNHVQYRLRKLSQQAGVTDWVIGNNETEAAKRARQQENRRLIKQVTARYLSDYAQAWRQFVNAIEYPHLTSLEQTQATISAMADHNGLVTQLIQALAHHTELLYQAPALSDVRPLLAVTDPDTDRYLNALRLFTGDTSPGRLNGTLSRYLQGMAALNQDLVDIITSYSVHDAALDYSARVFEKKSSSALYTLWNNLSGQLGNLDNTTAAEFEYLFIQPLKMSWEHLIADARVSLVKKWRQKVYPVYARSIRGRYPFSPDGTDASLKQVISYLNRESGLFWQFIDTDIRPFIYDPRKLKKERSWQGVSLGINLDLIDSLRTADQITDGLFRRKSETPRISYQIMPVPKQGILESYLNIHGYEYRYRNEPEEWHAFVWPSRRKVKSAKLYATSNTTGHIARLNLNSDWSLYHLIDKAEVKSLGNHVYRLSWLLETRRGEKLQPQYKMKLLRRNHLFDRQVLYDFSLPMSVLNQATAESMPSELDLLVSGH